MMPSAYGSSEQQLPKKIAINQVVTVTKSYGNYRTITAGTPISGAEQLTATVNSGTAWAFPDNSIARGYGDPSSSDNTVFHSAKISFSSENLALTDLPDDGSCEVQYIFSYPSAQEARGVFGVGESEGSIRQESFMVRVRDLNRASVFQSSTNTNLPTILDESDPIQVTAPATDEGREIPSISRLNLLALGAQIPSTESSFITLQIKILLANGRYLTSAHQQLRINVSSVVENMEPAPETFTIDSIIITPKASTPPEEPFPQQPLPEDPPILPVVLNSDNSFTIPDESLYYEDPRFITDPPNPQSYVVGNSFEVAFNTSTLTATDFPENDLIAQIVLNPAGLSPYELGWIQDGGTATQIFEWQTMERSQIITGGVVMPEIAFPEYSDSPFHTSMDANGITFGVKVRIQNTLGDWVESQEQNVVISANSINPL